MGICFLAQVYIWLIIYVSVLVRASPSFSAKISKWYLIYGDQSDYIFEILLNPKYLSIFFTTFGIVAFVFFLRGLGYLIFLNDSKKQENQEESQKLEILSKKKKK